MHLFSVSLADSMIEQVQGIPEPAGQSEKQHPVLRGDFRLLWNFILTK